MRYSHLFQSPSSPSDAGLVIKGKPNTLRKPRLPNSRHHHIRKTSISTMSSSSSSSQQEMKKPKVVLTQEPILEAEEVGKILPTKKKPVLPQLSPWESYLHWLTLTEEPGTLWSSSLATVFQECLSTELTYPVKASECAARIDDIYWSFYLPLDPLFSFMEDRILSGYLLHVWTMFIELGKKIPYNDPAQEKLVELLKELVHLPPMEVRTWDGNDAPWTDLPTLDDALMAAWDDLYDPEVQSGDPETQWVNYFAFLGRLVAAEVTPAWWEIPAITLREVLLEDVKPTHLTKFKSMALAEFMNQAGEGFLDWCLESGTLDAKKNGGVIAAVMKSPVQLDWFERRDSGLGLGLVVGM